MSGSASVNRKHVFSSSSSSGGVISQNYSPDWKVWQLELRNRLIRKKCSSPNPTFFFSTHFSPVTATNYDVKSNPIKKKITTTNYDAKTNPIKDSTNFGFPKSWVSNTTSCSSTQWWRICRICWHGWSRSDPWKTLTRDSVPSLPWLTQGTGIWSTRWWSRSSRWTTCPQTHPGSSRRSHGHLGTTPPSKNTDPIVWVQLSTTLMSLEHTMEHHHDTKKNAQFAGKICSLWSSSRTWPACWQFFTDYTSTISWNNTRAKT